MEKGVPCQEWSSRLNAQKWAATEERPLNLTLQRLGVSAEKLFIGTVGGESHAKVRSEEVGGDVTASTGYPRKKRGRSGAGSAAGPRTGSVIASGSAAAAAGGGNRRGCRGHILRSEGAGPLGHVLYDSTGHHPYNELILHPSWRS